VRHFGRESPSGAEEDDRGVYALGREANTRLLVLAHHPDRAGLGAVEELEVVVGFPVGHQDVAGEGCERIPSPYYDWAPRRKGPRLPEAPGDGTRLAAHFRASLNGR
jgi:hypothetical protein